jgi:hypothetical protein
MHAQNMRIAILASITAFAAAVQPVFAEKPNKPIATTPVSNKEITAPAGSAPVVVPTATVLNDANYNAIFSSLKVKRAISGATLRTSSELKLGNGRVNMAPLFNNPSALPNVANRLRAKSALVQDVVEDTRAVEIDQGLVVRTFLSYQIKPGACNNAANRAQLETAGASCATRLEGAARASAYANPLDPHYVADPAKRAQAIKNADSNAAKVRAEINADIAQARSLLGSDAGKAQIEAEVGAVEAARLAKLSDAELEAEAVNSAIVSVEQIMFLPKADLVDKRVASKNPPLFVKQQDPPLNVKRDLDTRIFLTGFTLGRDYEWGYRVSKSIKWCVVGCKKTYYAEAKVKFGYAFGLRFPIKVGGTYDYSKVKGKETATLTPTFTPINGSEADFASTGLAQDKLYGGKELVAQYHYYVGFGYHVPWSAPFGIHEEKDRDFTNDLSAPFTGGQFEPPAPGTTTPGGEFIFDKVDLLAGRADFKVVGAKVFPAVKVALTSESLKFTLRDGVTGIDTALTKSGQPVNLGIFPNRTSAFSISDPIYNLAFLVTPGLDARLFIDLSVWSHNWDWPVWFPQIAVTLPPGGVDFSCHEGTNCTRSYLFGPDKQMEADGNDLLVEAELDNWGGEFDAKWLPQCATKNCQTGVKLVRLNGVLEAKQKIAANPKLKMADLGAIFEKANTSAMKLVLEDWGKGFDAKWLKQCSDKQCKTGINFVRVNAILEATQKYDAQPASKLSDMSAIFAKAETNAAKIIQESQLRQSEKMAKTWALIYSATWTPKCADDLCRANVKKLADEMGGALVERQKQNPDRRSTAIQAEIGGEYAPRFQKEIDASIARVRGAVAEPPTEPPTRKP